MVTLMDSGESDRIRKRIEIRILHQRRLIQKSKQTILTTLFFRIIFVSFMLESSENLVDFFLFGVLFFTQFDGRRSGDEPNHVTYFGD